MYDHQHDIRWFNN